MGCFFFRFAEYVGTNASDDNMESLRAYSESRGWDWQDVLAGGTGDDAS
jgi:hypothetical protein